MGKIFGLVFCAVALASAPAIAGQQYCSDDADTYYVERIPFGFAVVRMAQADFCKQDIMTDDPAYVCDGDAAYKMSFVRKGEDLIVSPPDGGEMTFKPCTFENPDAYN